jgi:transcriptional regulator with XRE-family HTH domain
VDAARIGRQFRALRVRRQLRQLDIARASKLSRPIISRIERGLIDSMPVSTLIRASAPLGAVVDLRLRWNGEQLDRLLDEPHARLVDVVVAMLQASGWDVAVEVSFSLWGERGSIDVLAHHRATDVVLVVEAKSVVPAARQRSTGSIARRGSRRKSPPNVGGNAVALPACWSSDRLQRPVAESRSWRPPTTRHFPFAVRLFAAGFGNRSVRSPVYFSLHTLLRGALVLPYLGSSVCGAARSGIHRRNAPPWSV